MKFLVVVHKRSEQNKKNRSKLTVNHAAGSRSFQRTRACMKNQESGKSILQSCIRRIIQTKMGFGPRKEREKFMTAVKPPPSSTLTTQSSDLQHQLAKARDEIEAMRAAREKDLQEFEKKQAEMHKISQILSKCKEPFRAALSSKVRGIILHCLLRQMTSTSKRGRDRTRGVSMEKSLQSGSGSGKLSMHIPEGECGGVSSTAATLSTKIGMLVRGLILISVNKWANVPVEVKEYIMDQVLERMDAFQRQCDLEGKTYTEIEHQLAKARDEIETMRDAREKDLQEFVKKQAKMEATLRDHREEQRVEQERIGWSRRSA
ncbi:hypothetical protein CJ030_MR5G020715 [Morella rubra]|uniref:Uncharacterized protein n=1 Tax=Morella rubra TaxID=262757 RepID=A0A6A1VKM6_9ROSI|nr:hypothetical protein CJ030_MR5G020715 [Morella rubra]